jgi:hypothetical protein
MSRRDLNHLIREVALAAVDGESDGRRRCIHIQQHVYEEGCETGKSVLRRSAFSGMWNCGLIRWTIYQEAAYNMDQAVNR